MPLQLRRGTEAERTAITPVVGEPLYTTDDKKLYVGDGSTAGGVLITGGGAPTNADYLVKTANGTLTAERVVTDSTSVTANWATGGQVAFERAALTGDVTASANGNTTTIANDAVTFAKMQNIATDKLLGRATPSSGDVEEITCTAAGRALLDDADAAAQRTTLGLGTIATQAANNVAITGGSLAGVTVTTGTYSSNVNEAIMHAVRKASGGTINKGEVVRITGSVGTHLQVELADASAEATSTGTIGIAATSITTNDGYMMIAGELTGLSNVPTGSFANGAALWLSTTTGGLTTTRPPQPAHGVFLGWVVNASNGSAGRVYVKVINYSELGELHDVLIDTDTLANNHFLVYESATSLWKNESPSDARTSLGLGTVATESTVPINKGGTGQTTATAAFDALAPTGSKGDLVVHNGTESVALAVGTTNNHVLTVDSSTATGLKWAAASGGSGSVATDTIWDAAGDLAVGSAADTAVRLARGTAGQVLTVNAGGTDLEWAAPYQGTATYAVWTPLDNQPPASNYATLDTRNSIAVLDFDDGATNEAAIFVGIIPQGFTNPASGTSFEVIIHWVPTTTPGTTTYARWGATFQKIIATDIASDSFDSEGDMETRTAASTSSGIASVTTVNIPYNKIDSLAAGNAFRLKVYRDSSNTDVNTGDNLTGDAEVIAVELRRAPVTGGA
jgi:hypothetical protein